MLANATRRLIKQRLSDEIGRIDKDAPRRVALAYPSPYSVAMSSLGYQQIYRAIQAIPGTACERVFLADAGTPPEIALCPTRGCARSKTFRSWRSAWLTSSRSPV